MKPLDFDNISTLSLYMKIYDHELLHLKKQKLTNKITSFVKKWTNEITSFVQKMDQ